MAHGFAEGPHDACLDQSTSFVVANGELRICSGSRPATGKAGSVSVLLAEPGLREILAASASGREMELNPITSEDSAPATGEAKTFSVVKADKTVHARIRGEHG